MITREQVADLCEGDVVEAHRPDWAEGTVLRGPLTRTDDGLWVADLLVQWSGSGDKRIAWMLEDGASLAVISHVPTTLYVNHPRAEPVPGDVAKDAGGSEPSGHTWHYLGNEKFGGNWWRFDDRIKNCQPKRLRLLVDGETGQVVQ